MKSSLISKDIRRLGLILILLARRPYRQPHRLRPQRKAAICGGGVQSEPMLSPQEFRRQEEWRAAIGLVPRPRKGCFTAKFPSPEWQSSLCAWARLPYAAASGHRSGRHRQWR